MSTTKKIKIREGRIYKSMLQEDGRSRALRLVVSSVGNPKKCENVTISGHCPVSFTYISFGGDDVGDS